MAQDDFYGDWNVHDTSGTPYGLGTTISIGDTGGEVELMLNPPVTGSGDIETTYNEGLDRLEVTGIFNTEIMYISRYVDEDNDFYGIYGLTLMTGAVRTAVFMAGATATPSRGPAQDRSIDASEFAGLHQVSTTTGAQFGKKSTVDIGDPNSDGACAITITNVTGERIKTPPLMFFDDRVCALRGAFQEDDEPVRFQVSLAPLDTGSLIYGLSVVGDPEEAGAWGGEEDPGPDVEPDR